MPNVGDVLKNDVARGVAIGCGLVAAGWLLAPALRPAARAVLKNGLLLVELGREKMAEAGEAMVDLVAEVRAELTEARVAREQDSDRMTETPTVSAVEDG